MDSAGKIITSMQQAAHLADLPVPSAFQVKQIIGISLKPAIMRLFNLLDEEVAEKVVGLYKQAFADNHTIASPLFEGVIPLLTELRSQDKQLAVATGKARQGLQNAWSQTGTEKYFTASKCADEAHSKPHPDMLEQILSELSVSPAEGVMIGDTSYDMAMAEAIGMDRIGVSYGVHEIEQLKQHSPVAVVENVSALARLLS